jgi:hypothetical protein
LGWSTIALGQGLPASSLDQLHGSAGPWAGSPLPHLAQLSNMAQPAPTSRPMAEAGETLPWRAGGGGRSIPVRDGNEVVGNWFEEVLGAVGK